MGSIEEFIDNYHLVVDTSKSSDEILFIRSSIRSGKEVKSFMQKFEQKTCTIWRVHYGNYSPKRVVFHRAWVCRHSSIRSTDAEKNNCEAKLDILVKKINSYTIKNDNFLLKEPPLPCIIRMRFKHNHSYEDDIKYLKIPDEVKELYYSYFNNGYGVAEALRLHEKHLKRDETFSVISFVPSNRQVYYLYRLWQRRYNDLPIAENNIVDNDPWIVFNWDEFIKAIPRENPPVKIEKNKMSDSQGANFSDEENCKSKNQASLTNFIIKKEEISNSVLATSGCVKNESSAPETVYLLQAPIAQQIAYSSNHMNGSVVTVMNSNSVTSCSSFLSNPIASIITPISTPKCLVDIPSQALVHFSENNSFEIKLNSKDPSVASLNNLETVKSRSNYLHQSKVLDLSKNETTLTTSGNDLKNEQYLSLLNKISESYKNTIYSQKDQLSPIFHNGTILTQSNNQTSCTILNRNKKSETCDNLNSPASLSFPSIKPKDGIHDASSASFKLQCSESSTNTQIHITNTVHQSGAQVSMKSSIPSIVNILPVSELLGNSKSSEKPVKIKGEPLEEEDSDFSPTIIKIASVDVSEKVKPVPSIKIEKTVGNIMEKSSSNDFSDDSNSISQVSTEEEDEDYGFLKILLQELKQLPNPLKNKLKRKMQSLVSSALIKENCRKRRKL